MMQLLRKFLLVICVIAASAELEPGPTVEQRDGSRQLGQKHNDPLLMDPLLGAGFMTMPDNTMPDVATTLHHMRCRVNRTNMLNLQLARGYNATKRLAVITGRDKNYGAGDYYRAVMQVKHATSLTRKYCRVWSCDYHEEELERNEQNRCSDLQLPAHKGLANVETDFPWCKLLKIRALALKGKYDYIMWLDADAAIVDQAYDVRLLMDMHPRAFLLAPAEHWRGYDENVVNSGVMMFRVTPELPAFLADWWNTLESNKNMSRLSYDWDFEQGVLNLVLLPKYGQEKIAVLPSCFLFEWPQHVLEQGWVVHLPVASPPRKAQEKGRYFRFWDEVYSGGSTYSGISDPGASGSTVTETGEPGQYSVTAGAVQTLAGGGGTARAGVGSSQRGGLRGGGSKGGG